MLKTEKYIESINSIIDLEYKSIKKQFSNIELLLYYYSLYKVLKKPKYSIQFEIVLNEFITELTNYSSINQTFCDNFINGLYILPDIDSEKPLEINIKQKIETVEQDLFKLSLKLLQQKDSNQLQRITSVINYFILRLPNATIENYLLKLLPFIYRFIEKYISGSKKNVECTETFYLGFSQGLAGILHSLVSINVAGIKDDKTNQVLTAALKFILSLKREIDFTPGKYAMFPYSVDKCNNEICFSSELTWANSDLNHCILFYKSDQVLNNQNLHRIADLIGLNTLIRKDITSTQIIGSNFNKGAAGVAQTYRNMFELSKLDAYWEGYEYWIQKTIYLVEQELNDNKQSLLNTDMLNGIMGVNLTLLSYISEDELSWNKMLFP